MPERVCLAPLCPNPATYRGRCADHARSRDQAIIRPGYKIYRLRKWKLTRQRQLFEHPLCKCGAIAEHVHHVRDIGDGGDPWSSENLASLCASCHSKLTRAHQRGAVSER